MSIELNTKGDEGLSLSRCSSLSKGTISALGLFLALLASSWLLPSTSTFWHLSRSAGFVAYTLLWLDFITGVLLSAKSAKHFGSPGATAAFHQALTTSALGFSFFHALVLLGDKSMGGTLEAVLIPFVTKFHPIAMAMGQLASWLLLLTLLTTRLRKTIGYRAWHKIHMLCYLTYWFTLAHALYLGSDIEHPLAAVYLTITGALALMLSLIRILNGGGSRSRGR